MTKVDLKDAYLHIPIHSDHQKFLRFYLNQAHYQFQAMPFGLTSAPRIFTKVLGALVAEIRSQGVHIYPYLDDILIYADSATKSVRDTELCIQQLTSHGWLINHQKSILIPQQVMPFLGMIVDTVQQQIFLPQEKILKIQSLSNQIQQQPATAFQILQLLGLMAASLDAVPFARYHMRPLQREFLRLWNKDHKDLSQQIPLSKRVRISLQWWSLQSNLARGKPWRLSDPEVISTDASLKGWGAAWKHLTCQGLWSSQEKKLHINVLEIRAIHRAITYWSAALQSSHIRIQTDNSTAVAYLNKQGETSQQSPPGKSPHNPDSTKMAKSNLVCRHYDNVSGSHLTTDVTRPTHTRSSLVPRSPQTTFDGISLESDIWKQKGFHPSVITTLLAARRPSTNRAYYRVWRTFLSWCSSNNLNWNTCTSPHILHFLQNGFDMNLSITSLKVQTSALAALFHKQWALMPEVRLFFQALQRIKPPIRDPTPSWDLNLVLAYLQHKPFEPLESANLKDLTLKTVFLIAIASARRVSELAALSSKFPWLKFHQDKAVLRTNPSFIPKMATTFHLNQEIVIPVLKNNEDTTANSLDPVRALKEYILRTKSIRQSDSLFLLFGGPKAGLPASKRSIARWLVLLISEAYNKAGRPTPMTIRAHATRKVSTSWALHHEASLETICQAATWSSPHTFTKFYKFDVFNAAPAEFGRKVLKSAEAPI
ncbi:hypothetical protein XENTR_v10009500 [Xenopus tropicalis]|nr:hypothetical protein XENTR_v10009500 [Xenopus tropicalis]